MKTDRYKNHNIEAVVDKLVVKEEDEERIRKSVKPRVSSNFSAAFTKPMLPSRLM